MPKVSAVVVTHNRIGELPHAIDSVLGQTFADIELIVVNDASEDGTKEYVSRLASEGKCQAVNLKKSAGAATARNIGATVSSGELIAFLDDDDRWHPTKIAEQVPLFSASDMGAVYCAQRMIFDRTRYLETKPTRRGFIGNDIFTTMLATSSAMMYSRFAFDSVKGFDEKLTHWQDLELNMRMAQRYAIDFVPNALVDVFVDTKAKSRLSNQYMTWLSAVSYIRHKHMDEIWELSYKQKQLFDRMCEEDGLSRLYHSGQRLNWWRKSLSYFLHHPTPGRLLQLLTVHDRLFLWKPLLPVYREPEET